MKIIFLSMGYKKKNLSLDFRGITNLEEQDWDLVSAACVSVQVYATSEERGR